MGEKIRIDRKQHTFEGVVVESAAVGGLAVQYTCALLLDTDHRRTSYSHPAPGPRRLRMAVVVSCKNNRVPVPCTLGRNPETE